MHNKKGFTIIEVITYIAVFSVMFFVIVPTIKYLSDYVLGLNAKSMAIVIRNAQTTAISSSIDSVIYLGKSDSSKEKNEYEVYSSCIKNSDLEFELPFRTLIDNTSLYNGIIRYYSTGKVASGCTITLKRGDKQVYISVNACVGRTRVSEDKDSQ